MSDALRFVILHHTGWPNHPDHFDLLLQLRAGRDDHDRVLKAFATVDGMFPTNGAQLRLNEDHRRAYLEFEGAISGDRGTVVRVDTGALQWLDATFPLKFRARGTLLCGSFCVRKVSENGFVLEIISEEQLGSEQRA